MQHRHPPPLHQPGNGLQGALAAALLVIAFGAAGVPAQSPGEFSRGQKISGAMAITDQSARLIGSEPGGETGGFGASFKRFLESHRIVPEADRRLERAVPPLWLQDDVMGRIRDRPPPARTGPEIGTFFDSAGRLRFWTPAPPPAGRVRVLQSPPAELLRRYTEAQIDWQDETGRAAATLDPAERNEDVARIERNIQASRDSRDLYRWLRRTLDDASEPSGPSESAEPAIAKKEPALPVPDTAAPKEDSCTFPDEVLTRITDRLVAEADNPSRVASLTAHFAAGSEMEWLRNCICRVHSGAAGDVSVWFQSTPHDSSPSCRDVRNGPCVSKGYGCWRTPFVPDSKALEACGAARIVSRAVCQKQRALAVSQGRTSP